MWEERQLLADIARRVDTNHVARRMVRAFRAEIAAYRRLPESALNGQVLEISKLNVDTFFDSVIQDRDLRKEEVDALQRSARNRAAEGLPLADLLHAYRIGGRLSWEALVDASTPGEQAMLVPSVTRLLEYVDRVSEVVTKTYHDWLRRPSPDPKAGVRDLFDGEVELDDQLPELLLASAPRIAERVRRRALGPLEDHSIRGRADLLETLRTFVSCNLDRRRAAKRLHVHPNTLDYRLRRVEELTGLRLGSTSDLVLICLALKQRRVAT